MHKRIAITGLGSVTPLGNDLKSTWDGCVQGRSGIDRISKFDPTPIRSHMAGEVKNFVVPAIIPHKEVKKMDTFIHYAIAAAHEALVDT